MLPVPYLEFFEQGGSADIVYLNSGGQTLLRAFGHFVGSLGGGGATAP